MADNPNPNIDEHQAAPVEVAPIKKKGVKRRTVAQALALCGVKKGA